MGKLKLTANPTFKAKVPVPIAGGNAVDVEMVFKHRTRKQWDEWIAAGKARSDANDKALADADVTITPEAAAEADVDAFMDVVVGWELEEEFTRENVSTFLQNYLGAGTAAIRVYASELWNNKLGN